MAEERAFNLREFLNPDTGLAAIHAYIEMDSGKDDPQEDSPQHGLGFPDLFRSYIDAEIIISDCTRQTALDFFIYGGEVSEKSIAQMEKDIEKKLLKVHKLRDALVQFAEAYETAVNQLRVSYSAQLEAAKAKAVQTPS